MISFLINILLILYTTTQGQKKEKPKAVDNKNPSKKKGTFWCSGRVNVCSAVI
jgi:hypothetical protein